MDWIKNHIGSMGYAGDFWIPQSGTGAVVDAKNPKFPGPRVVHTDKYDFPRLQKFFDWDQFLDYADWSGKEHTRASQIKTVKRESQTMTRCFDDAMNLARNGWFDGINNLQKLDIKDLAVTEILKQKYEIQTKYDVAGGAVNIGRYLSGIPDCMRRLNIQTNNALPSRIQKVIILGTFDTTVSTDQVLQHGYTVYQIIEALELANIQTEITIAFSSNKWDMRERYDYYFYETYIKIKNPEDVVYPEKILFCLAHPSMLRRLVFSEWERNPAKVRDFFHFYSIDTDHKGYGHHIPEWTPPYPQTKDTLIIPHMTMANSLDTVIQTVKQMINEQYKQR